MDLVWFFSIFFVILLWKKIIRKSVRIMKKLLEKVESYIIAIGIYLLVRLDLVIKILIYFLYKTCLFKCESLPNWRPVEYTVYNL